MNDIEIVKRELKKRSQGQNFFGEVCHIAIGYIDNLENTIKEKQKHLENLQKVNEDLEKRIAIMSEGKEWISVEDHMPDEGRGCFVVIHYDCPYAGEGDVVYGQIIGYSSGDWVDDEGEIFMKEVTHWQYANIPEPPKEGDQ